MIRQHIVFLTGAGISAESGIPTFRGPDGLWNDERNVYLASSEALYNDTSEFIAFINDMRQRVFDATPNAAHAFITDLEKQHQVTVITQNIDDLHERAGSTNVIHLHGELARVCSSDNRHDARYIREMPMNVPIELGDDAGDGSQLRPHVTLFGEYVSGIQDAAEIVKDADIFVVIGTSLTVHPAAELIRYAHPSVPKFIINPNEVDIPYASLGYKYISSTATEGVIILKEELKHLL
jgi:NAD-dependent deacetylase